MSVRFEMTVVPCRLFVIVASRAPAAVVFRRGPSAWYQVIAWDLSSDTFTDGAWFKGRIYEEKCDVSPDGRLLLYACHGGANRDGYTHAWTAVSRLPWLAALGLWPLGTTYGGGGRFVGDRQVTLRGLSSKPHPKHPALGLQWAGGDAPVHASTGEVEGADWSGRDDRNRLIYAKAGRLFRVVGNEPIELADFNGRTPDPQPAPPAATRPLGATDAGGRPR